MATEKKHELKDIQFFEEDGQYYLKLKYIIEDVHRVKELEIPKVKIPFNKNMYPNIVQDIRYGYITQYKLNADFEDDLWIFPGETSEANHVYYTEKTIQEKHKEMTLAEIEKKLGYKIKIVAEE